MAELDFAGVGQNFDLSPTEQQQVDQLTHPGVAVAAGLAGAFLLYRGYMSRRLMERMKKSDPSTLQLVAASLFQSFLPRWTLIVTPMLIKGYRTGMREAAAGTVPDQYLVDIATAYAQGLGTSLNDVSFDAMVRGYNAQVNRKVPPARAAQQVASAYGVTPRAMNTIVAAWNTEDPKVLSQLRSEPLRESKVAKLILADVGLRAKATGDTEAWTARTQAKQIVWMYGMEHGVIPKDAKRMWITAKDEKVCEFCGPLHRKKVPVGEKFAVGKAEVWTPPAHPNCRCDLILDFSVAADLQDELSSMLDQELVTKARGGDEFDRDRRGRFARTESRPVTHKDPRGTPIHVKNLWDEVQLKKTDDDLMAEYFEAAREKYDIDTAEEALARVVPVTRLSPVSRPTPVGRIQPVKRIVPASRDESTAVQKPVERTDRTPVTRKGVVRINLPSREAIQRDKPGSLDKPIPTGAGDWFPLDQEMYVLVEPWNLNDDGSFVTDEATHFHLAEPGLRSIEEKLKEFWDSEIVDIAQEIQGSGPVYVTLNNIPGRWQVENDDIEAAILSAVSREPIDKAATIWLYRGEGEDFEEKPIDAFTLGMKLRMPASNKNIHEKIDEDMPRIFAINHGFPGTTEINVTKYGTEIRNPGKWVDAGKKEDPSKLSTLPYIIRWVKPIDMD